MADFTVKSVVYQSSQQHGANAKRRPREAHEYPENRTEYIDMTILRINDMITGLMTLRDQLVDMRKDVREEEKK